jgi:hypothetical protein
MEKGCNLLEYWCTGIKTRHISHNRAAMHYKRVGRLLGIPVVILTTVVGTAVFSAVSSPNGYSTGLQILAGFLSMAATVLSGLQTFLNYPELAERHQEAAIKYGVLRREVEQTLTLPPNEPSELKKILSDVNVQWKALEEKSPSIPQKIFECVIRESPHEHKPQEPVKPGTAT